MAMRAALFVLLALVFAGCSGKKAQNDGSSEETRDQKLENLTSAVSRLQSRVEEFDAKLSALSDKADATRLALDNFTGNKPIRTEHVGSAARDASKALLSADDPGSPSHGDALKKKAKSLDGRALLKMDSAISEFTKSMGMFKAGKYADAELAFNHFTERYPEHVLAGSAQFYAGESYFQMGQFKLAANEYGKVLASFGSSPRVASALVRLAHCHEADGNTAEASRVMAHARELFHGNPSLEWPPSSAKVGVKGDLKSGPIEPTIAPHSAERAAAPQAPPPPTASPPAATGQRE